MVRPATLPTRAVLWTVFVAMAILWFANLGSRALLHPDEGRYAEIAREMAATGDWVTPRLNGLKYFEKPPFQYWVTAAAYRAFGVHEWTARLWPALAGLLAVVAIGRRRTHARRTRAGRFRRRSRWRARCGIAAWRRLSRSIRGSRSSWRSRSRVS